MRTIYCPKCGYENDTSDLYCIKCGHPMSLRTKDKPPVIPPKPLWQRLLLPAGIAGGTAAAAAVICLVGIPALYRYNAVRCLENGSYAESLVQLDKLGDRWDAAQLRQYADACLLMQDGLYAEAAPILESLEILDAEEQLRECRYCIACAEIEERHYAAAVPVLLELQDYKDASQLLDAVFETALSCKEQGDLVEAADLFLLLDGYGGAEEQVAALCEQAGTLRKSKKYAEAAALLLRLGDFGDAPQQAEALCDELVKLAKNKEDVQAAPALVVLFGAEDFRAAAEEQLSAIYKRTDQLEQDYYYKEALEQFRALTGYLNAEERAEALAAVYDPGKDAQYEEAVALIGGEDRTAVIALLEELGDYKDASQKLAALRTEQNQEYYDEAMRLMENKSYDQARAILEQLGDFRDAPQKLAEAEEMLAKIVDISGSWQDVELGNGVRGLKITKVGYDRYNFTESSASGMHSTSVTCSGTMNYDTLTMSYSGTYTFTMFMYDEDDNLVADPERSYSESVSGTLRYSGGMLYMTESGGEGYDGTFKRS